MANERLLWCGRPACLRPPPAGGRRPPERTEPVMKWKLTAAAALLWVSAAYVWSGPAPTTTAPAASQPASTPPGSPEAAQILAEARRILANTRATAYTHHTRIDEAKGLYELDCAGLCRYILRRVLPGHLAAVVREGGRKAPRSAEFCDSFSRARTNGPAGGWVCIPRLTDARPGDILTWRHDRWNPGESTGHTMILVAAPVIEKNLTAHVQVIDSSTSAPDDPKTAAGVNGLALRTRWLRVDDRGLPIAYGPTSAALHPALLAIGRAVSFSATRPATRPGGPVALWAGSGE